MSATVDAPPTTTLRIEDLHVSRGARQVLEGVNIEIPPGEVTALLGPNGAGKSSLVLTVGGALRASSGHVWLDGDDLSHRKPEKIRAAGIAVVPEGRRLLRELTVEDNLRVATYTLPRDQAAGGIDHAVELFPELRKRWDVLAGQLSGGEQQMVVLAQALVSRPKFILVDELSLGLAPVIVKRLVPTLTEVADSGVGVLLIEQFAHVALGVSKSAYVIEGGRIRYQGTSAELREHPELLQSAYLLRDADEAVVEEIAETAEEGPTTTS
ncbi:MAG: branched-chain amino acid transport system ATP-binding protein [Solirubrobacteraceae bacterium]|nr:branched-chain amino acid transport system ATP-binding protein [Solirubrobacteraceae bacterium]